MQIRDFFCCLNKAFSLVRLLLFVVLVGYGSSSVAAELLWSPTLLERSGDREKEFQTFNAWLSAQSGLSLSVAIEPDYERMMQRFEHDEVALLWVGPQILQQLLKRRPDAQVLAMTRDAQGKTDYHCVLFTRQEYRGDAKQAMRQSLALTQPLSTCGSVGAERIARYLGAQSLSGNRQFTGSHQNAVVSVMLGETQSGIVAEQVFERFSWLPLRKLLRSPALPSFAWIVNPRLVTPEQQQALVSAFAQAQTVSSTDWYVAYRHGFETEHALIAQSVTNFMQGGQ